MLPAQGKGGREGTNEGTVLYVEPVALVGNTIQYEERDTVCFFVFLILAMTLFVTSASWKQNRNDSILLFN